MTDAPKDALAEAFAELRAALADVRERQAKVGPYYTTALRDDPEFDMPGFLARDGGLSLARMFDKHPELITWGDEQTVTLEDGGPDGGPWTGLQRVGTTHLVEDARVNRLAAAVERLHDVLWGGPAALDEPPQ